jgi:hypothetical protein
MERRKITPILVLIFLEILCTGMGMGVPILNILLGFPIGWYITRQVSPTDEDYPHKLKTILKFAVLAATLTFVFMAILWGQTIPLLFDPGTDFENFGHPFILFDPKLSFIGWLVLMILISPFLRLLTTISAAFITLTYDRRAQGIFRG